MPKETICLNLLRRRRCPVPTSRGWTLLIVGVTVLALFGMREVHPFLALNDPAPGGVLVVDGGMAEPTLEKAVAEFDRDNYHKVYVTGGPLLSGALLTSYHTFAAAGAERLVRLGVDSGSLQPVPSAMARRDPTYQSALSLADWLRHHDAWPATINVISEGPRARRARLLFRRAFGKGVRVGVIAEPARDYDPHHWWRSSVGVRTVIGETLGYGYARFVLRRPDE